MRLLVQSQRRHPRLLSHPVIQKRNVRSHTVSRGPSKARVLPVEEVLLVEYRSAASLVISKYAGHWNSSIQQLGVLSEDPRWRSRPVLQNTDGRCSDRAEKQGDPQRGSYSISTKITPGRAIIGQLPRCPPSALMPLLRRPPHRPRPVHPPGYRDTIKRPRSLSDPCPWESGQAGDPRGRRRGSTLSSRGARVHYTRGSLPVTTRTQ